MAEKSIAENPSAFPLADQSVDAWAQGMSLRDWFAGQAITGMLATNAEWRRWCARDGLGSTWQLEAAKDAYSVADAMLLARKDITDGR